MAIIRHLTLTILGLLMLAPSLAQAQVFGTFAWQMQPFCNVVSLTLVNTPAGFTLQGTDDQCGAVNKAGAFGIASFNASGNVTANFTVVTAPGAKPVHVSAVISVATGGGTWTDSAGNTGTFVLGGAATGLPPRPIPASGIAVASITSREIAPDTITGVNVANGGLTSIDVLDGARATSVEGTQNVTLVVGTHTNVREITLTAPASGRIVVTASATAIASSAGNDLAECSITTGAAVEPGFRLFLGDSATLPASLLFPLAMTRGFVVTPGSFKARLMCRSSVGVISLLDTAMTAEYFPG